MTKPAASDPIAFAVAGSPAPQGSKSAVINHTTGRAQLLEGRTTGQRQKFKAWRNTVATAAMIALRHHGRITPLLGPVAVDILFVHTRPQSTPKGQRWRTKSPDIDKMARACLDALKVGGCIGDDNQVAELTCRKVLALPGETEGAVITITPLDHTHAPTSVHHLLPAPKTVADGVGTSGQAHRASTAR
jgi:Holliday junction resolvase RusA-like endonuclease